MGRGEATPGKEESSKSTEVNQHIMGWGWGVLAGGHTVEKNIRKEKQIAGRWLQVLNLGYRARFWSMSKKSSLFRNTNRAATDKTSGRHQKSATEFEGEECTNKAGPWGQILVSEQTKSMSKGGSPRMREVGDGQRKEGVRTTLDPVSLITGVALRGKHPTAEL